MLSQYCRSMLGHKSTTLLQGYLNDHLQCCGNISGRNECMEVFESRRSGNWWSTSCLPLARNSPRIERTPSTGGSRIEGRSRPGGELPKRRAHKKSGCRCRQGLQERIRWKMLRLCFNSNWRTISDVRHLREDSNDWLNRTPPILRKTKILS